MDFYRSHDLTHVFHKKKEEKRQADISMAPHMERPNEGSESNNQPPVRTVPSSIKAFLFVLMLILPGSLCVPIN